MKINIAEPYTDKKIKYKILEVIESRHYVEGRYTKQFEEEFSKYIGVKHAVTVSSGTSSLFLILKALGIGPGDKIAVPDFTFIATLSQGVLLGAKPVLIDVDYETMCMDPDDLRRKLDEDVKAVIPVHLFGHPAPMDEIIDIAVEYGAYVIEDAAQAHGAKYKGRRVGSIGDIGYFSLYPSKNLGVYGEGGVITTNDDDLAARIRRLKNHGIEDGVVKEFGYNMKFNEINAVVALETLKYLDKWNERRRRNALLYNEELSDIDVEIPIEKEYAYHVYNLYTIKSLKRDEIASELDKEGIGYGIYYREPLHMLEIVKTLYGNMKLEVSKRLSERVLSLPVHPFLNPEDIVYISKIVKKVVES